MNEILNKKLLVDAIAEQLNMTKKDATCAVEIVFEEITKTLANKGKVDISGFGKFEVSYRPEREGINPAKKTKMMIPASYSAKFKAAKALKDAVNAE
ncbi:MAG: HU family DNA-binding protein [Erysipelotrichaceae bacterium]|nr:HU family DNA-binding protein [Erysipelotrichaceae bacterium]